MNSFSEFDDDSSWSYSDYLNQITEDNLYDSLLGYGMLGDKLPPVFTSVPFMEYCKKERPAFKEKEHGFISYRFAKNLNFYRELGIPVPMAYEQLCSTLSHNWSLIRTCLNNLVKQQKYKVSRIHLRKTAGSRALLQ